MKFLLVIAVVLVAFWLWRSARRRAAPGRDPGTARTGDPQEMVRCAVCGVFSPRSQALEGPGGLYCSREHRQRADG